MCLVNLFLNLLSEDDTISSGLQTTTKAWLDLQPGVCQKYSSSCAVAEGLQRFLQEQPPLLHLTTG